MPDDEKALIYYTTAHTRAPYELTYVREIFDLTEKVYDRSIAERWICDYLGKTHIVRENPYDDDVEIFLTWYRQKGLACNEN